MICDLFLFYIIIFFLFYGYIEIKEQQHKNTIVLNNCSAVCNCGGYARVLCYEKCIRCVDDFRKMEDEFHKMKNIKKLGKIFRHPYCHCKDTTN